MKWLTAICLWFLVLSAFGDEMRDIWVDAFGPGFQTKEQVTQLVSDCRKYNFNAVFVQMRKRGDAFYFPKAPNEDPRNTDIEPDFDALAEVIKQCHTGEPRIEVHCWVVEYFVWAWEKPPSQKNHVFNKHPEWLTRDYLGQHVVGKGYYLDPGNPDANLSLLNIAKDIVSRYDIDGFHWDYLRYPVKDSGYNEVALKRYKKEFGAKDDPAPTDPRFCAWRRRQVTDFTRWSTAELLAIKPKLVISAAVFANFKDSYEERFQDWVAWNKEGILDVTVPMDFSTDNRNVFEPRAAFAATNQWSRAVWLGQGAYMNPKENTLKQLLSARDRGFPGTAFYSYWQPSVFKVSPTGEEKKVEVVMDNDTAEFMGDWKTGRNGKCYGEDYRFKDRAGEGENYAKYVIKLPASGNYWVDEWHVAGPDRATEVSFEIRRNGKVTIVKVNQQTNGSCWHPVGRFHFDTNSPNEIRITDEAQSEGRGIVVDAVRFVLIAEEDNVTAAARRANQESTLDYIKENFQPRWEFPSVLPWKNNPKAGIIEGAVIGSDGRPVYNATVRVTDLPGREQKTEPHGAFAFFEVSPGLHRMEMMIDGTTTETEVKVAAGQVVTAHFPPVKIRR